MSGGVPAGWVLVPVEPTLEMKVSATTVAVDTGQCSITALNWEEAAEVWSAMLSAVPTPAPPTEGRDADVERAMIVLRNLEAACESLLANARRNVDAALQALGERG